MVKLLSLLLIGFIIYYLIRGYIRRLPKDGGAPRVKDAEDMVQCRYCGTHLPRSESLTADGKIYCSDEHRRADA